jgi:hypothetical protein
VSSGSAETVSSNTAGCRFLLNADSVVMFKTAIIAEHDSCCNSSSDSLVDTVVSDSSRGFAGYDDEYRQCLGYIRLGLAINADQQSVAAAAAAAAGSTADLFRPPKGLLLHGPAGTGKSRMMRSLVQAVGCRSVEVSHSILLSG